MTDYTAEMIALRKAIATGARRVTYDNGRNVEYDSFEKLKARLSFLENLQNPAGAYSRAPTAGFARFDRGDR